MKKVIKEEQYSTNFNAGTFRTKEEALSQLQYLRQKYGFDESNSFVNGTTVVVEIEKSVTDDNYYYDMINAMKKEKSDCLSRYRVAESKNNKKMKVNEKQLAKMITEAISKTLVNEGEFMNKVRAVGDAAKDVGYWAGQDVALNVGGKGMVRRDSFKNIAKDAYNGSLFDQLVQQLRKQPQKTDPKTAIARIKKAYEYGFIPENIMNNAIQFINNGQYKEAGDELFSVLSVVGYKDDNYRTDYEKRHGAHSMEEGKHLDKIISEAIKKALNEDYEEEDFIGDELETIDQAVASIRQKMQGGNLAGADEQSLAFLEERVSQIETAVSELLSDDWY